MSAAAAPIIALRDAVEVLRRRARVRDATIALRAGEVRALVGENGAGKSTHRPPARRRHAAATPASSSSTASPSTSTAPHDARDAGIAVIYQEPTLFPDLSASRRTS